MNSVRRSLPPKLTFAGERTDSFHNFQGFMEGAAQSGIRAAEYFLNRVRNGLL